MNRLDLRGIPCPQNSARALLKLSTMDAGEILIIIVDLGEPAQNVPESLEFAGHEILKQSKNSEGLWEIQVKNCD
ncbi:MAG: sulfurtransferase TusA family protein [Bacteriovoracaceae bacterium]